MATDPGKSALMPSRWRRHPHAVPARPWVALVLLGWACSGDSPTDVPVVETVDELLVTVRVRDRADRVLIDLDVRNTDTETRTVQFPSCNPFIELRDDEAGRVLWDERRWREDNSACLTVIRNAELQPGATVGTHHEVANQQVLGDSLASGVYRIRVVFSMVQPDAELALDAGTVRIEDR